MHRPPKPIGWLAVPVIAGLFCFAVLDTASLAAGVVRLAGTGAIPGWMPAQDLVDLSFVMRLASSLIQVLLFVLVIVFFCIWVYRCALNVRVFGAQELKSSPGFAVGWYFIPIAHLFMPFRAMSEIWRASSPGQDPGDPFAWQRARLGLLVPAWWAAWILGTIVGNYSTMMARKTGQVQTIGIWASPIGSALQVLAAVLCALVVIRLTRRQTLTARERTGDPAFKL